MKVFPSQFTVEVPVYGSIKLKLQDAIRVSEKALRPSKWGEGKQVLVITDSPVIVVQGVTNEGTYIKGFVNWPLDTLPKFKIGLTSLPERPSVHFMLTNGEMDEVRHLKIAIKPVPPKEDDEAL